MKNLINAIYVCPHNEHLWLCVDASGDELTFDVGIGRYQHMKIRSFIMALAVGGFEVVGRLETHCIPPCPVSPERARTIDAMTMAQIEMAMLCGEFNDNDHAYVLGMTK